MQRKSWKEGLIKQMESTMNMEPQPLPDDLDHLQSMEYQTVAVRGRFIHEREMYLGPRSLIKPDSDDTGGGLMSTKNTSGYLVITPFKLEDREETILVNRGWVSRQHIKPESRPQGQVQGSVEIFGVVRHPEPRPQFSPDHRTDIFLYRDVPRMCQLTGADPIFLDSKTTFTGGPIGGQTRVTLRNEHLSYIVTWFSLSAFTSYFWWKQVMKRVPV
jgi:surfeit locus 1 family protein